MRQKIEKIKPQIMQVWRLSLPAILTQITTIAMQYIDSAMVGDLGANASAAVGLVSSTTWLLSGVASAVSAGFSVQVAHQLGAGNEHEARNVVRHGLIIALIISIFLCVFGVLISEPLPIMLGGEVAIREDATQYFITFALMLPFLQLNSLTSSFLQCSGDMVTPSVLNAVMCILDVAFNAIFIPIYGVLGAGIGTALSFVVISVVMTWCCCIRNGQISLYRKEKGKFNASILTKALKIGAPVAIQEIAMNGAMIVSTMIIAPLGAVAIAANSFAVTAESLCYMPGYGIGSAATTLVGKCVGAGDEKAAKSYGSICTAMGGIFMGIIGMIMMILCPLVFKLLTPDLAVRKLAAQVLRMELIAEPLFGISIVAAGVLRGAGDTFIPSILNLGSIWIVRLILAALLVKPLGLHGVWIAMAVELCVRGILMLYRQKTSKYYSLQSK